MADIVGRSSADDRLKLNGIPVVELGHSDILLQRSVRQALRESVR
jgi:hypothetical protein